jgi:hypothetical protein
MHSGSKIKKQHVPKWIVRKCVKDKDYYTHSEGRGYDNFGRAIPAGLGDTPTPGWGRWKTV